MIKILYKCTVILQDCSSFRATFFSWRVLVTSSDNSLSLALGSRLFYIKKVASHNFISDCSCLVAFRTRICIFARWFSYLLAQYLDLGLRLRLLHNFSSCITSGVLPIATSAAFVVFEVRDWLLSSDLEQISCSESCGSWFCSRGSLLFSWGCCSFPCFMSVCGHVSFQVVILL